ncbi:hypothetical protein NQ315_013225, partial [Exocentrus adspersus]
EHPTKLSLVVMTFQLVIETAVLVTWIHEDSGKSDDEAKTAISTTGLDQCMPFGLCSAPAASTTIHNNAVLSRLPIQDNLKQRKACYAGGDRNW